MQQIVLYLNSSRVGGVKGTVPPEPNGLAGEPSQPHQRLLHRHGVHRELLRLVVAQGVRGA